MSREALWYVGACCALFSVARGTCAQVSMPLVPVRALGRQLATSMDTLGTVSGIRQLSDGRVIVNDIGNRQLLLFDSTLSHAAIVVDTTADTKKAYGAASGGVVGAHGDTTLFVDPVALAMLVIDPRGRVVGTEAPPRPGDAAALLGLASMLIEPPGLDAAGRIVYRGVGASCSASGRCSVNIARKDHDTTLDRDSNLPPYARLDSIAVLRGDIQTHVIDTVGFVASFPHMLAAHAVTSPDGSTTITTRLVDPIPPLDAWAVVTDGAVAFIRGRDYHIDWVNPDGTRSATPPVAHQWHRLSDSERTALIDSVGRAADSTSQAMQAAQTRSDSINRVHGRPVDPHTTFMWTRPDPSELPDYWPAFFAQGVRADADTNIWIPETLTRVPAGAAPPIYDVVDRRGQLVDRIRIPPSLMLAGFGPGVVYFTSREGRGTVVAKYRIR